LHTNWQNGKYVKFTLIGLRLAY